MEIIVVALVILLLSKLGSRSCWYSPQKNTPISLKFQNIVTSCTFLLMSIQNDFPSSEQFFKWWLK